MPWALGIWLSFKTLLDYSFNCFYICFSFNYSIEFDKDNDFFAIAGVTKKIKVFEYDTVIMDAVDIHYPAHEMVCHSKIRYVQH